MPKTIDLEEIVKKNPTVDRTSLEEWGKLRRVLIESGLRGRRFRNSLEHGEARAKLIDDPVNDPRLVRLRRE